MQSLILTAAFAAALLLMTACSSESLKRFGYAVGAQQACMAGNEDHVYESAEDLECTNQQAAGGLSYDEYVAARNDVLEADGPDSVNGE